MDKQVDKEKRFEFWNATLKLLAEIKRKKDGLNAF